MAFPASSELQKSQKGKPSIPEIIAGGKITADKDAIAEKNATGTSRLAAILCLAIGVCALCCGVVYGMQTLEFLRKIVLGELLVALSLAELVWRAVLALRYRPVPGCDDELLPDCTVVVPAFNEGKQVFVTLESLAASDYPKDKLQLIAVDDGSVDDTWEWIRRAEELLGGRVITIKQPRNKGKRHALYAGFQQSTGEILVTVDSDSIVTADTLRNLVAPFVADKKVGAVAGNLRVLNMDKGMIPKMLDVAFVYTSNFLRASQSMVKAVLCTPGALSAYRRSVVMNVLQEWLHQTFCGQPANIGEDRALTNLILREGHHVVFQRNAWVYTEAPVTYANLCKMFLRWARGDFRENIALTRFIFTPFREGSLLGARINLISNWVATVIQVVLVFALGMIVLHPITLGVNMLLGVIISSSLAAIIYAWKFGSFTSLWAFMYGFYSLVSLSWIGPYALITPHKSGWLTRQIKLKPVIDQAKPALSGSRMFLQEAESVD